MKSVFIKYNFSSNFIPQLPARLNSIQIKSSITTSNNLLALHGLMGSSSNFKSLLSNNKISSKLNSYLLDLRNHGKSEHRDTMNIEEMAIDLKEFIINNKLDNLILMGHSLGGKIVMSFATLFPEFYSRIKGIIIIDIAPINYWKEQNKKYSESLSNIELFKKLNQVILKNKEYSQLKQEIFQIAQEKTLGELMWTNVEHDKNNHRWRVNFPSIIEFYPKILEYVPNNQNTYQGKIKIFKGKKSDFILEEYYQNFKSIFKNIHLKNDVIVFEEAGHWLHYEKPYEFIDNLSKSIDEFLIS